MTATIAPLPMYDFPELAGAHDRLWRSVSAWARRAGLAGEVPLTQVCGYPLLTSLSGAYDVVAAPVYDVPFSAGSTHCGLIVVPANANYAGLEDLRGARFAVNATDSNTGMNLPRRRFAPLARAGRFFGGTVLTGSHAASLEAVARGEADAASIDNVTFALLAEHRPEAVRAVCVIAATAPSPTPPFVTPAPSSNGLRALLFEALAGALDELIRTRPDDGLHLPAVERASLETYAPLVQYEREAAALGYGVLL
jgi:ABC-type phosphate/phosphonate transport system substrate-binding protein